MIIFINYFGVGIFGEFEFWLSSAKVLIMLGLIIFTLVLAIKGRTDQPGGFQYWVNPGAFAPYLASKFFRLQLLLSRPYRVDDDGSSTA